MDRRLLVVIMMAACPFVSVALDNGLGLVPPMGWRSWEAFYGNVDQMKMTVS
jgi:hypothetical protein